MQRRNQSASLSVFFLTTSPSIHGPVVRFRLNCSLKDLLLKAMYKRYADLSSTSTPMRSRQISEHKSLLSCLILFHSNPRCNFCFRHTDSPQFKVESQERSFSFNRCSVRIDSISLFNISPLLLHLKLI